jgi:hypothetical protein
VQHSPTVVSWRMSFHIKKRHFLHYGLGKQINSKYPIIQFYTYNKKFMEETIYFPLHDTDRTENDASNNSLFPRLRLYQAVA